MDAKEIKIEMIRKGISQTKIAQLAGVSPSMVQRVIHRMVVSRPVAGHIADALGFSIEEIFPESSGWRVRRSSACN